MTTQANDNRDLAGLQRQLTALHAELQQSVTRARRRARRSIVVLFVLVLTLCGYWSYIYNQIAKVDADFVTDWAYYRTMQLVTEKRPEVTQAIKDRAPEAFDMIEAQVLQAPGVVAERLRTVALERTQFVMDQSEPVITKVVVDAIDHAKASTAAAGFDGKDPVQMQKMIDALVAQLHADMRAGIDHLYMDYNAKAHEVLDYIDRLAAGKDLNPREQHLRQVTISFLALDQKHKQMQ